MPVSKWVTARPTHFDGSSVFRQLAGVSTAPHIINGRKSLSLYRPSRIQNSAAKGADEPQPCADGAEHGSRNKQPLETREVSEINGDQNHEIQRAEYCSGNDSDRDRRACESHHASGGNWNQELKGDT
jgi:hypothetical protein